MIVREITEAGTLLYEAAGLDPRVVVSKRVAVGPNDVPGVIGAKAIHLQSAEEHTRALKHTDLYVDIGAKDRADAKSTSSRGDYISFTTKFSVFGEGLVRGKALDDRVGCAIVLELFKNSYDCDLWAVFTVQEELGPARRSRDGQPRAAGCRARARGGRRPTTCPRRRRTAW